MLKSNKAITLIVLMITIITLLILIGATISLITGDNGLINKAKTSVAKYKTAQTQENAALAGYETEIDNSRGNINELIQKIEELNNSFIYIPIYNGPIENFQNIDLSNFSEIRICFTQKNTGYQYSDWKYYSTNRIAESTGPNAISFLVTLMHHPDAYLTVYIKKENDKYSYSFSEKKYFDTSTFDLLVEGR